MRFPPQMLHLPGLPLHTAQNEHYLHSHESGKGIGFLVCNTILAEAFDTKAYHSQVPINTKVGSELNSAHCPTMEAEILNCCVYWCVYIRLGMELMLLSVAIILPEGSSSICLLAYCLDSYSHSLFFRRSSADLLQGYLSLVKSLQ